MYLSDLALHAYDRYANKHLITNMLLHVHSDTKGFDQLKSMIVFKFQIIFESSWRGVFSSLRRDMSVIVFVFDLRSLSPKYNMHPHISEMKLNIAANRELGIIILRQ